MKKVSTAVTFVFITHAVCYEADQPESGAAAPEPVLFFSLLPCIFTYIFIYIANIYYPRGEGPILEAVQYQADP